MQVHHLAGTVLRALCALAFVGSAAAMVFAR